MEKDLEEKLNKIGKNIQEIKGDVSGDKIAIQSIKNDLQVIKQDIAVNKTNILVGFEEAKKERGEIRARIEETYNAVDGFIKVVTKLEQEFTMVKEDLNRVKTVIKEKLGVDLF